MDIGHLLKSTRAARRARDLPTRPDAELVFFADLPEMGEDVILDACVYIDQIQGRMPSEVADRIVMRSAFHSSLALAEIFFPFGRLDPADSRTERALGAIEALAAAIPDRRILVPSAGAKMRGSIMAGAMARVLGYNDAQRRKALIDGMLAAQATQENLLLVTRNVADFDRLSQLDGKLKVALYRL